MADILVIEDREDTAGLVRDALESEGYDVRVAGTGEDGLDMMGDRVPDLLVLDFMLPGISGETVLNRMQDDDELADVPVLILTAAPVGASEEELLFEEGADAVLLKPVKIDALLRYVSDLLR